MTKDQEKELEKKTQMQIANKIKYLGIWLTQRTSSIKENNYDNLVTRIKQDLDTWGNLQISFFGRISAIKMNVLPKLLYLFQVAPIKLKKTFFENLNKITSKFIWQGKRPRIRLKLLQDLKERGGTGLPDWEIYYQAAGLTWLKDWMELSDVRTLTIEGHDLQAGWHSFLWDGKNKSHTYFQRHTIRNSLLTIWQKIKKQQYTKIPFWLSPSEILVHPTLLTPNNILRYKDLVDYQGKLKTKEQMEVDLNKEVEWWTYLQIKSKHKEHIKEYQISKKKQDFDNIILGSRERLISKTYKFLLKYKLEDETVKHNMIQWMQNFKYTIELDKWEELWQTNLKTTLAVAYKENQLKMFYRWHISPTRLAKMNPKNSSKCWKCKNTHGTFYHLWWTCPTAKKFWSTIKKWLEQITKVQIDKKPEFFLLGIFTKQYPKDIKYLIIHILTAARIIYAQKWKLERPPTEEEIIDKISQCAEMDRLTKELKEKEDTAFYEIWNHWYDWRNTTMEKM